MLLNYCFKFKMFYFKGYSYVAPSIIYSKNILTDPGFNNQQITTDETKSSSVVCINNTTNNTAQQSSNGLSYVNNWLKVCFIFKINELLKILIFLN